MFDFLISYFSVRFEVSLVDTVQFIASDLFALFVRQFDLSCQIRISKTNSFFGHEFSSRIHNYL